MRSLSMTTLLSIAAVVVAAGTAIEGRAHAQTAGDQVSAQLRAMRIAATNPERLSQFYTSAYGFEEVRRINGDGFVEIIMREKGAPQGGAALVIITKPEDLQMGRMASLILGVQDLQKAIDATKAAGGTVFRESKRTPASYAMVLDLEGNQIELLVPR